MKLKDKVCIVTGAAGGIGSAAALRLSSEGAVVVVCDVSRDDVDAACAQVARAGGRAVGHVVDVTQRATIDSMVADVLAKFGRVDVLVNNAGITGDARLVKMSQAQWDKVIGVNLTGVFNCTQAVAETMIAQRSGSIINTSSIAGVYGNFGQTSYAATKAGVIGLTKTWARECGPKGVRVNAVVPGTIATPILDTVPKGVLDRIVQACWMGRVGRPEEVAAVYAFLASDDSSYVNGTTIEVSGGVSF